MMFIAWTTVGNRADAEKLALTTVKEGLAACAQIEGPITSIYAWQGRVEQAEEFRLGFKCVPGNLPALEARVLALHPYDTPEWLAVRAERVGEKYLSWAEANFSTRPL